LDIFNPFGDQWSAQDTGETPNDLLVFLPIENDGA